MNVVLRNISLVMVGISCSLTVAAPVSAKTASARIKKAVNAMAPLAQSGVQEFKIKPTKSIKEAMLALALKSKSIDDESDFSWSGKDGDAWGADSSSWGETTMKGAYSYVTELDDAYAEELSQPGSEKEKAKVERQLEKAKEEAFKHLLNTGVMFGIAPMGAVRSVALRLPPLPSSIRIPAKYTCSQKNTAANATPEFEGDWIMRKWLLVLIATASLSAGAAEIKSTLDAVRALRDSLSPAQPVTHP